MTYQEFNNIYYTFTKNKKGIRPNDPIKTNGYELKEFVEYALKKAYNDRNSQLTFDSLNF